MSGLELVVRPVVLRDTRPTPQPVRPVSEEDENLATIAGSGGGLIDLAFSYSNSWSKNRQHETKRKYDEVRVYNDEDPDMYLDYEAVTSVWTKNTKGTDQRHRYARVKEKDKKVEILKKDQTRLPTYDDLPKYEDLPTYDDLPK